MQIFKAYVFDEVLEPICYYPPEEPGQQTTRRSISTALLGRGHAQHYESQFKNDWVERATC